MLKSKEELRLLNAVANTLKTYVIIGPHAVAPSQMPSGAQALSVIRELQDSFDAYVANPDSQGVAGIDMGPSGETTWALMKRDGTMMDSGRLPMQDSTKYVHRGVLAGSPEGEPHAI
jgi:hypothetical protein